MKGTGVFFPGSVLATAASPAQTRQLQSATEQATVPATGSSISSIPEQNSDVDPASASRNNSTATMQQQHQPPSSAQSVPIHMKPQSRPSFERHHLHRAANTGNSSSSSKRSYVTSGSAVSAATVQQAPSPPPPPPPPPPAAIAAPAVSVAAHSNAHSAAAAAAANAPSHQQQQQQQPPTPMTRHLSLIRGASPMEALSFIASASDLAMSDGLISYSDHHGDHHGIKDLQPHPATIAQGSESAVAKMTQPYLQDLLASQVSNLRVNSSSSSGSGSSISRASTGVMANRYIGSSGSSSNNTLPATNNRAQPILASNLKRHSSTGAAPVGLLSLDGMTIQVVERPQQQQQLRLSVDLDEQQQPLLIIGSPVEHVHGQWPSVVAAAAATPPGASPTFMTAAAAAGSSRVTNYGLIGTCQSPVLVPAVFDHSLPMPNVLQTNQIGSSSGSSSISCPLPSLQPQQQQEQQQQQQLLEQQINEKHVQLQLLLQLKQQSASSATHAAAAATTSAAAAAAMYAPLMLSDSGTSLLSYVQPVAAATGDSSSSLVGLQQQQQQQQQWSAQATFPDVLRHSLDLPVAAAAAAAAAGGSAAVRNAFSLDVSSNNLMLLDASQSAIVGGSSSSFMPSDYSLGMQSAAMQQTLVLQQQQMPNAQHTAQHAAQQHFNAKLQQLLDIKQREIQLQNELLQMLPDC